jgi:hypothetical protein
LISSSAAMILSDETHNNISKDLSPYFGYMSKSSASFTICCYCTAPSG